MTRSLVIGLGKSGAALAVHLAGRGDTVLVADRRPEAAGSADRLPPGVETLFGPYDESVLDGRDEVYASPGVPWDDPILEAARRSGRLVSSEIDLFFALCPGPIVGITGTNGKTTTTALTGEVLRRGSQPVIVGGNIGDTVLDRLDEITPETWVVLELSSFQLETVRHAGARVAAVLNVTPDHLDRHGTMAAYVAAKARLVEDLEPGADAVLNGLDPVCRELAGHTAARVTWFDRLRPDPPMPVPGTHNLMNARAAAAIGLAAGIDRSEVDAAIAGFRGVEHRLERVGEWAGVEWFNDSKATNPDAGRVALASFPGRPVVLIAGGRGGGFELGGWAGDVRRCTSAVVLLGESAAELEALLAGHRVLRAESLEEAVGLAASEAVPGGVVLLSPAHKSYDMFSGYEERGRRFKEAVRARMQG